MCMWDFINSCDLFNLQQISRKNRRNFSFASYLYLSKINFNKRSIFLMPFFFFVLLLLFLRRTLVLCHWPGIIFLFRSFHLFAHTIFRTDFSLKSVFLPTLFRFKVPRTLLSQSSVSLILFFVQNKKIYHCVHIEHGDLHFLVYLLTNNL